MHDGQVVIRNPQGVYLGSVVLPEVVFLVYLRKYRFQSTVKSIFSQIGEELRLIKLKPRMSRLICANFPNVKFIDPIHNGSQLKVLL